MLFRTRAILVIAAIISTLGCGMDNKYKAAREDANDISGNYTSSTKADGSSVLDMTMDIENEYENHDVAVFIERAKLTNSEKSFYTSLAVPLTEAENNFRSLGFGVGRQSWLQIPGAEGGDNVSRDEGKTSILMVCSNVVALNKTYFARYCINGRYIAASGVLNGSMTAYVYLNAQDVKMNKPYNKISLKFLAQSIGAIY